MAHQKRQLASDPAHAAAPSAAVPAHVREYAPRAPRRRHAIARRLETDLPLLVMLGRGLQSLAAVPAHVREYAPRAPRRRHAIARRLETDLPLPSSPCCLQRLPSCGRRGRSWFGRPQLERPSSASTPKKVGASHNRTWAELMRRGLDIDVLECPDCGGRLGFVAAILVSSAIRRILRQGREPERAFVSAMLLETNATNRPSPTHREHFECYPRSQHRRSSPSGSG